MLLSVFKTVLAMSVSGGLIAVMLMLAAPLTRRIFNPRQQYYIALASVIFLICPISFGTLGEEKMNYAQPENMSVSEQSVINLKEKPSADFFGKVNGGENSIGLHTIYKKCEPIVPYMAAIWLAVALILVCSKTEGYIWFKKELGKNSDILKKPEGFPEKLNLRRTDILKSPMITGIFRPTLYLSDIELSPSEKNLVLKHEIMHYRRGDTAFKWVIMLIKCIHWFNPIVYMLAAYIERECEASCDFEATRKMSESDKKRYMHTLVDMIERDAANVSFAAQMSAEKNNLKYRIMAVKQKKSRKPFAGIISFICAFALMFSGVYVSAAINNALGARLMSKSESTAIFKAKKPKKAKQSIDSEKRDFDTENQQKQDENGVDCYENNVAVGNTFDEETITKSESEGLSQNSNEESLSVQNHTQSRNVSDEYTNNDTESSTDDELSDTEVSEQEVNKPDRVYGICPVSYKGETPIIKERYTSQNGCRLSVKDFICENGEFYIFFKANMDTVMSIEIFDSESHKSYGGYSVPSGKDKAYKFDGYDPSRKYDIEIKSESGTDWKVEGVCYIYF